MPTGRIVYLAEQITIDPPIDYSLPLSLARQTSRERDDVSISCIVSKVPNSGLFRFFFLILLLGPSSFFLLLSRVAGSA